MYTHVNIACHVEEILLIYITTTPKATSPFWIWEASITTHLCMEVNNVMQNWMKSLTFLIIEVVQFPSFWFHGRQRRAWKILILMELKSNQPRKPCPLLFLYEDKTQKSLVGFYMSNLELRECHVLLDQCPIFLSKLTKPHHIKTRKYGLMFLLFSI